MRNCTTSQGSHRLILDALIVKQASNVRLESEEGDSDGRGWGVAGGERLPSVFL